MKASYLVQHGGPEVLQYGDVADPVAQAGQVLVDIHAASVNGADWKVRSGAAATLTEFPYVLGRDFSGVVCGLGEGVTDLKIGDAVFGVCDIGQEGAYAEQIAIKAALIAKKSDQLSHVEAAAVALIGLTALVSIEDTLQLQAGETILIQGGAGGVASFAIQLAKHIGAICDAVFETVGSDIAQKSFAVLKPGGRAAFIGSGPKAPEPVRDDVRSLRPAVGRDREHLDRIVELVVAGIVKLPEINEYSLSDAVAAHRISEGRHLRGKMVFKIR